MYGYTFLDLTNQRVLYKHDFHTWIKRNTQMKQFFHMHKGIYIANNYKREGALGFIIFSSFTHLRDLSTLGLIKPLLNECILAALKDCNMI